MDRQAEEDNGPFDFYSTKSGLAFIMIIERRMLLSSKICDLPPHVQTPVNGWQLICCSV